MIKVQHVSKSFPRGDGGIIEVLRDLSFEVKSGECVAIVGPSGCGKTTILRLMAGLERPSHGATFMDDAEVVQPGRDRGVVFQNFSLFPWASVADNIAFGLRLHTEEDAAIEKVVERYLAITGLAQFHASYPKDLSGGMRQRVAIARTLANKPKLLLLDEPFASLDVETRFQMQEFLARLWEEERVTTILVTHDIDEALYVADRVVVLGTKPGTIKDIIDVALVRPRRSSVRRTPEFVKLKSYINYLIQAEHIRSVIEMPPVSSGVNPLRLGVHAWPGVAPFYLAKERGIFAKHGIAVEILGAGAESNRDRLLEWKEGRIDVVNSTLDAAVLVHKQIPEARVLMATDLSYGSDAILAVPGVESVKDLKGKRIGVERTLVGDFFLGAVLEREGLTLRDVNLVGIKVGEVGSALIAGTIDAGVIWEPWLSRAKELSDGHILASSRDVPVIYSVLLVKSTVWEEKRQILEKLIPLWRDTILEYRKDPAAAIKTMAPYFGASEFELGEQLDGLRFVDPKVSLGSALVSIQDVLLKEGIISSTIEAKDVLLL
jgi:NitT/TauT family transport system ATP-binding protein